MSTQSGKGQVKILQGDQDKNSRTADDVKKDTKASHHQQLDKDKYLPEKTSLEELESDGSASAFEGSEFLTPEQSPKTQRRDPNDPSGLEDY